MAMPSRWWCTCAAALLAAPVAAQQLTPVERARVAAALWSEARYNVPAWDRIRADWDSGFADLLGASSVRESDVSFHRRLRRFVALLGEEPGANAYTGLVLILAGIALSQFSRKNVRSEG